MQCLGRENLHQVMTCIHDRPAQLTQERYVWAPDPLWPRCQEQWEAIACGLVEEMHTLSTHFCHDDAASSLTLHHLVRLRLGEDTLRRALEQKKELTRMLHMPSRHL